MSQIDENNMRRCCNCGECKPLSEYPTYKKYKKDRCLECYRDGWRAAKQKHPAKTNKVEEPQAPEILKTGYWVFTGDN